MPNNDTKTHFGNTPVQALGDYHEGWIPKYALTDGYGNPIQSFNGALNVHDPHGHNVIINEKFHQHTTTATTFAVDAPAQSTSIAVVSSTGFTVGDPIHIEDGVIETNHPIITLIVGNVFTLDRPLDNAFAIGDSITKTIQNMNVVGSLLSPQSFRVIPRSGEVWHLMRILIEITHSTSLGDNGLFGDLPALTNGVLLRRYDGTTAKYNTFTDWKDNGDIMTDMYDVNYSARSGNKGSYGTNARGTFYATGAVLRLDADAGDFLELLIQDDLSALDSFRINAQGHIEGV